MAISKSLSGSIWTTGRCAIVAGLLAMSTLSLAPSAHAASLGHHGGMSNGPTAGPAIQLPTGRLHGHEGPTQAPPYAYGGGSADYHRPHHFDHDWRPDGPVSATTGLKPR